MATARPFAYNPGTAIPGTEQIGNLSIGYPTSGFTNNPQYWNGPDEELGYVIAQSVSGNTQPTSLLNPSGNLTLSTTYIGNDIGLSNGNQTASQQFGYQQTVLGNTIIGAASKVMFSVLFNTVAPGTLPGSRVIGIGRTNMNYKSIPPYGAYPGNDDKSMGYCADGTIFYNGGVYASGFSTWTENDVIDIVINNNVSTMWVRVNGGNWNNNPSDNPETNTGGFEIINSPFYPALCPGYEGVMTIQNSAEYGTPSGYTLLGSNVTASVGFFRSTDLTEGSFIEISETIAGQSFATGNDAKTWLNNNGYWTSYEATPDPTPTATLTPTVTTTPTPTITPTIISCLDIATNSGGGLNGWSTTAFDIAPNPAIGTTYPVGSQILFQNGEIRTMVQVDDYSPSYMDIFYDSPIGSTTLFPIKICYPSIPMSTPTPTSTSTPTTTPTNTPTPSSTPTPVTGYSFNLIATPYNFPASGNSIMNGPGGSTSGSTDINDLATLGRGFYLNSFDNDGIDRTSYYSGFTGQSVTITFNQTGNTAIYSGDTNSFKQWIQSPQGSGFVFGTNVGVPPSGTPSGTAVLIQSATTQYTIGFPVYVSLVVN